MAEKNASAYNNTHRNSFSTSNLTESMIEELALEFIGNEKTVVIVVFSEKRN